MPRKPAAWSVRGCRRHRRVDPPELRFVPPPPREYQIRAAVCLRPLRVHEGRLPRLTLPLPRLAYPQCDGAIRITLRSDDRHRGHARPPDTASPQTAALSSSGPTAAQPTRASVRDAPASGRRPIAGAQDGGPPRPSRPLTAGFHRQLRSASLTRRAHRSRVDRMAARSRPEVSPSVHQAAQTMGIAQVLSPKDPDPNRRVGATSSAASTA